MTLHDWLSFVIVLVCLLLSAFFFAGSETALTASSRASMTRLEKHGNRRAAIVNRLLEQRERLIGALLFGNNAVNIAASSLATGVLLAWFGEAGVVYATVVMTAAGGRVLRGAAEDRGVQRARSHRALVARPMYVVRQVVRPGADGDRELVRALLKLSASMSARIRRVLSAREELRGAVDLFHREGGVEKLDRDMFGGVLDLRELAVVRRDGPPHQHDHARCRRAGRGRGQRGASPRR